MKRFALFLGVVSFPVLLQAVNIPTDVLEAQQGNKATCIQKKADACVNLQCTSGGALSEDRNCQDKCQQVAKAQCEVSSE